MKTKKIGEILNICLVIHKFDNENIQRTIKYNKSSSEDGTSREVHIASYLKHFFIYDKETEYTRFSIRNYNEIDEFIEDKPEYQNRRWLFSQRNGKYFTYRENTIKLDSLNLIKCLYENKFFIDFSYIPVSAFTPQLYEIEPNINNIDKDQENCLEKDKRENKIKDENDDKQKQFITSMKKLCQKFPCHICAEHCKEYIEKNGMENYIGVTVEISGEKKNIGLFIWSWKFHNAVNFRTKKPLMSWDTVYNLFSNTKNVHMCSAKCLETEDNNVEKLKN